MKIYLHINTVHVERSELKIGGAKHLYLEIFHYVQDDKFSICFIVLKKFTEHLMTWDKATYKISLLCTQYSLLISYKSENFSFLPDLKKR